MALGIYFAVQGMTPEKFTAVHEQLAAIGQANPPGRSFHAPRIGEIQLMMIPE